MKQFAQLIDALLLARFERDKQQVWADFLQNNSENESYVGLVTSLLKNECPKRIISSKNLKVLAMETVGIPHWLLDESKHFVGDMSETISLILAPLQTENNIEVPLTEVVTAMNEMHLREAYEIEEWVVSRWGNMGSREIQVFNKLVTGSFRSPFNPSIFSNSQFQMQPIALKLVLLYAERGRIGGRTGSISRPSSHQPLVDRWRSERVDRLRGFDTAVIDANQVCTGLVPHQGEHPQGK